MFEGFKAVTTIILLVLVVKNLPANAEDNKRHGSGRCPGGGHDNPLQYSCLENLWTEEPGGLEPIG